MIRAPAFTRICWTRSGATRAASNVTENSCHPSVALSNRKSTASCASWRSVATRASGSRCQVHCLGTSPQTDSSIPEAVGASVTGATGMPTSGVGLGPVAGA